MKHEFEKVINGISRYMNDVIYSGMNDWQEFAARVMVGRILENPNNLKETLTSNGFIKSFGIIDNDGYVDVAALAKDIKREITRKEKISFTIPIFGKYTFTPADVDALYTAITGEDLMMHEIN